MLVEPSCGATLAAGYSGLIKKMVDESIISPSGSVVFIVCGGNAATPQLLHNWKEEVGI